MGCFLGCFGISTKRKCRKPANKILPGDTLQKLLSYEPLDSSVSIDGIPDEPITSNSQTSNKTKDPPHIKIRKKVTFNLNVQTYEPLLDEETTTYQFLHSVEEKENEKNGAEAGKWSLPSNSLQTGSYPANYRYQNCRESYDEEDEMAYEESDDYYDDDDCEYDEDEYDNSDDFDQNSDDQFQTQRKYEFLERFDTTNTESAQNKMSTEGESKAIGYENGSIRSQYLCSVLNPIGNTSQWKEIKARAAAPDKHRRKENIAIEEEEPQISLNSKLSSNNCSPNYNQSRPLVQDIAVDASLSNWLISPTDGTKSCSIGSDTLSPKKITCDGSFSWRSREDRVILDITNL